MIAAANGAWQVRERANSRYSSGATTKPDTKTHTRHRGRKHPERRKDRDGLARYRRVLHIMKWRKRLTKIAITDDVKSS